MRGKDVVKDLERRKIGNFVHLSLRKIMAENSYFEGLFIHDEKVDIAGQQWQNVSRILLNIASCKVFFSPT